MKTNFFKNFLNKPFVKNYVAPVVRGAVQTVPGGGIIVQAGRNIAHEFDKNKSAESPQPHNWLSIAVQCAGIGCIVYAFVAKLITIDQVLELIKSFAP